MKPQLYTAVTGANSGIGFETTRALASENHRIFMICRNKRKAEEARDRIVKSTENEKIDLIIGDLASLDSVRSIVERLGERSDRLDLLINNAGIIPGEREETVDGYEKSFAVNHLAPFLLTHLTLGLLRNASDARVINVASEAHRAGKFEPENLQLETGYNSIKAYANSKLFNIMFTHELASRLQKTGITTYSLHPGTVRTNLDTGGGGGSLFAFLFKLGKPFMLSPKRGAKTSIYLATEPGIESLNGRYFKNRKEIKPLDIAYDRQKCRDLWEQSEKLAGIDKEEEVAT